MKLLKMNDVCIKEKWEQISFVSKPFFASGFGFNFLMMKNFSFFPKEKEKRVNGVKSESNLHLSKPRYPFFSNCQNCHFLPNQFTFLIPAFAKKPT
jgi:hypothetical protein